MDKVVQFKRINKDGLFVKELRMFLNGMEYDQISKEQCISTANTCVRIYKTFNALIELFQFDFKNIDYPKNEFGGKRLFHARLHSGFWLKIIDDYEKGDVIYTPKKHFDESGKINDKKNDKAFRNWSLRTRGHCLEKDKECWDSAVKWALVNMSKPESKQTKLME